MGPTGRQLPHWPDLTGQQGLTAWPQWLRQVLAQPEFSAALEHASPVLAARARAVSAGGPLSDRGTRRVVFSVMRYLLRASGRATPYGLFAGVAPGAVAASGVAHVGHGHRAVVRVRAEWMAALIDRLEADPDLQPLLRVRANNLLAERGGRFVLANPAGQTPDRVPTQQLVRATGPVRAALQLAHNPRVVYELVGKLVDEFEVAATTAGDLLAQMVRHRLLVTSLRPPMTVTDPLGWITAEVEKLLADAASSTAAPARDLMDGLGTAADQVSHRETSVSWANSRRRQVVDALNTVNPASEASVAVDLRLDATVAVPHTVMDEAARAAGLLVRLARPTTAGWVDWHGRFLERYGPRGVVPVLQAVDPDTGLGYPAGYHGTPPVPAATVTDRDRVLLAIAQQAALTGRHEIELDETTIGELAGAKPVTSIQPSTELTVGIHAPTIRAVEQGEFRLAIVGVSRRAGTTTGRFLDMLETGDRERIADQYSALPTLTRGALLAQVSAATPYTVTEDVARAPQVMSHLIPVGEYHDNRGDIIALDDLAVTADEQRLYLVSMSRRRVVEPVVLNAVELVHHTLPIVRFLVEIPTAVSTPCVAFDWGPAAARLPFLPGLRHGRTILSPARWLLPAAALPAPGGTWQEWSRSLAAWRAETTCPATVYLGDGDQRIRLDLAEPAHQALLRDHLARHGTAAFRAAPAEDAAGWIGGRPHEIVIPLVVDVEPTPPPQLADPIEPVTVRDHGHLPGCGGRVYAKLYGHPDRQTTILTEYLPLLLDQLGGGCRWWFLRYGDPEPHLRLRVTGPADPATVGAWAQRLRRAGLASRVVFDTDYPETARFGGTDALAAAEEVFAADSAAAIAQLTAADNRQGPDAAALTAASLLDLIIAFIGDGTEAMRWAIDHTRAHRPAPPRAVYDQAVLLANPHNQAELAGFPGGARVLASWQQRRRALTAYRDRLRTCGAFPPEVLLPDLLHLHHTRMAGPDLEAERRCLHLVRAAALSWTIRSSNGHDPT
ncbi:lantibiotic dehydratase [Natronosporangium hydrolyticum]|uniref:lantibiotic dehydratase n=1 Tax=Natronosporangium hydrolyticum TaxID=2811111 RepID=UPI0023BAE717|nr:lantibiotic dehydratase [Natronosporangium hydrolyticum]